MKNRFFLLLLIAAVAFASCKEDGDDDPTDSPPYVTDDLVVEERTNSLMLMAYGPGDASSLPSQLLTEIFEYEYKDMISHINMVGASGHPLYFPVADSIMTHYGTPPNGTIMLNGEVITDFNEFKDIIELGEFNKPDIGVIHKVTERDTAWVVDAKIKFLVDTSTIYYTIETYMVIDVPALAYDEFDLRFPDVKDYITKAEDRSFWIKAVPNLDSSATVIPANDTYVHSNILMANFNDKNAFGTNLADINPLGAEFFKGDVYGTRSSPIRTYFRKPRLTSQDLPFEYEPRFVTVIWALDPFTGVQKYVNSYSKSPKKN